MTSIEICGNLKHKEKERGTERKKKQKLMGEDVKTTKRDLREREIERKIERGRERKREREGGSRRKERDPKETEKVDLIEKGKGYVERERREGRERVREREREEREVDALN